MNSAFSLARLVPVLLAATCWAAVATAGERGDIKDRCNEVAGKFGKEMVKACIDRDIDAWKELEGYPAESEAIIVWCRQRRIALGLKIVKSCVDRETASREGAAAIVDEPAGCRAANGDRGWSALLECLQQGKPGDSTEGGS